MYLYQRMKGADAVEFCEARLDRFPRDFALSAVDRVEIYSATIDADGEDYCEIRVIDSTDCVIACTRWHDF